MARLGSRTFTFTWKIENFSMCPQQPGEVIESPAFVVEFLDNTEWRLEMYPRGNDQDYMNYISVDLRRLERGDYTQDLKIMYSLAALSSHGDKNIATEMKPTTVGPGDHRGYNEFCTREKIFDQECELLPNDTLTLRCRMSRCVKEHEHEQVVLEYLKTDRWNSRTQTYNFSARTRVRVSKASFVWPIKAIDELACDVKLWTSQPSVVKSEHSFDLSLHLEEDGEGGKNLHIEILKKDPKGDFVRCHIRTVGGPKSVQGKGEHYFGKVKATQTWVFPTFLNINDLRDDYLEHTDGALYLQCDFSISSEQKALDIVHVNERFPPNIKQRRTPLALAKHFEKLYSDGELVDLTLRVEDRVFKVHKLILSAVSDVFRRMFESGMKEEQSGIVDIVDLDPDTVERLLKYFYTDELEEMSAEDARKLYSAADKYNVGSLQCHLRARLTASLSVDTVCETLILANVHRDKDLLESVVDYICWNNNEVFHTSNWKDFSKMHGDLALKTMLQVVRRK